MMQILCRRDGREVCYRLGLYLRLARRFRSMFVFPVASPFRLRVSHHFDRAHVSSPRHVNRRRL